MTTHEHGTSTSTVGVEHSLNSRGNISPALPMCVSKQQSSPKLAADLLAH
jgi:hypothetical protein